MACHRITAVSGPRRTGRSRGLSLVEMALILPMLVLLTFAVIEYGWMFLNQHQVTNAAREAARYASLPSTTTTSSVKSQVDTLMKQYNLGSSGYTTTVTPDPPNASRGTLVSVQISVPYSNIELTGFTLLPLPGSLNAKVSIEKEGP